ncbi:MAG: bifunctional nuclease family protein [Polyangia bacterium]
MRDFVACCAAVILLGCGSASGGGGEAASAEIASGAAGPAASVEPSEGMIPCEVVDVRPQPMGGVLVLVAERSGDLRALPIVVGSAEGNAIRLRLGRQSFSRPLTHDLLENILAEYGVEVLKLEIDSLEGGVFLGRLYLVDGDGAVSRLDCRPSDGMALALGAEAPIHVSAEVLDEAGEPAERWQGGAPARIGGAEAFSGLLEALRAQSEEQKQPLLTPGEPLDGEARRRLGKCWFERPYSYMFGGGERIEIGSGSFGSFNAGVGGVMHYGSLSECAGELIGVPQKSYSDDGPIAALAGMPLYGERMSEDKPFGFYNPELVRWGYENLVPDPATEIDGVPAREIYRVVFARFFRLMADSYLYLTESKKLERETRAYWRFAKRKNRGVDGIEWLQKRYAGALPQYGGGWDGTTMTPQMAIGFWLRRHEDGTDDELWTGLRMVLDTYDADWYRERASRTTAEGQGALAASSS